ncbi:MAG: transglutaminase family protein [Magnetococcales bacterium]|nr:transglutaminase family protein [Magnetococcales bacterium]
MKYQITHRTRYRYDETVSLSYNMLLLCPGHSQFQTRNNFQLQITPQPNLVENKNDRFGNIGHYFEIQKPHKILTITAVSHVKTFPYVSWEPERSLPWELAARRTREEGDSDFRLDRLFLLDSPLVSYNTALEEFARPSFPPGRPALAAAMDLTARIHREFRYAPGTTHVATTLSEVLLSREGVCQDFAHLQIACLRAMGLAARYISGYMETCPPPGKPRLIGADASHAWLAVYIPDMGWIPLDPTNNVVAGESHITVAWGRDYSDVAPISGVITGGAQHTLEVSVDVLPVEEHPNSADPSYSFQPELRGYSSS